MKPLCGDSVRMSGEKRIWPKYIALDHHGVVGHGSGPLCHGHRDPLVVELDLQVLDVARIGQQIAEDEHTGLATHWLADKCTGPSAGTLHYHVPHPMQHARTRMQPRSTLSKVLFSP